MSSILQKYQSLEKWPGGVWLFGNLVGLNAPFFSKIHPQFVTLRPAYCEARIKDRRSVRNHLGSINAGALCSLAEMVGGLALDTCVSDTLRWIPKSMTVNYIAKARGTITATSEFDPGIVVEGDVKIPISVRDQQQQEVFNAEITFLVSGKKP